MTKTKRISKTSKLWCILGSSFLILMGAFHGSGFYYVSELITRSNAETFLKEIVPILFAHPSIHLIGLAALGILAIFLVHDMRNLVWAIAILVLIDAALGFYLGGIVPGLLLTVAASCFIVAGLKHRVIESAVI